MSSMCDFYEGGVSKNVLIVFRKYVLHNLLKQRMWKAPYYIAQNKLAYKKPKVQRARIGLQNDSSNAIV